MTTVDKWNAKLAEMKANRDERFGRTPKDNALEERLADEMHAIFLALTPDEQATVERPLPPRVRNSIIAQDEYGRLLGYEDC